MGTIFKINYLILVCTILLTAAISFSCTHAEYEAQIQDSEPRPYTVRYAPADESISEIDPPAFVWLPVEDAREYILEYSRRPNFPSGRTTSITSERTIHVPGEIIGSGKWYWRFGVWDEQAGIMNYSRARAFKISKNAEPVPFPDVEELIEKLNGVRPRNYVRAENLERYRELGKGPLKDHIVTLKERADKFIDQPLHEEPPFLSEDREQRKLDFVRVMRSTRAFNRSITTCATAYLLTGEDKYGQEARRGILHLATWDPEGSTNLFHNDEPGHEIIRVMANTYDWIYPLLSEDDKKIVRDALAARIPQLYQSLTRRPFETRPYESHAMDYFINVLLESCLSMAGELPVEEMLEYVLLQLWSPFFPPYGGNDGGWSEGPAYWQWSTATFLRNFSLVQQNSDINLTRKPWLQNTLYYKLYANPPYSKTSPFGDYHEGRARSTGIMYKLGVTFDNPYALWYDNQLNGKPQGLERFIYYVEGDDKGTPPDELPQARCFYDIGLACMHSDLANGDNNVQFHLRSSPFGAISHSFADQNAFVLSAYGEPLAISSGYYPYYASPHHSQWTWETKASNSLLVDGEGQRKRNWDSRGKIVNFSTCDYAHYALGDATEAYFGRLTRFKRHALFLRPTIEGNEPIIILFDDVASPGPATYDWLLHSLEEMHIDEADDKVIISRGSARLKVKFLEPDGLSFSQTDQFTVPPEGDNMPNQWHLNAKKSSSDSTIQFVTVLVPYREGHEAVIPSVKLIDKPGWIVIELSGPSTRQVAAFRNGAKPGSLLRVDKFRTRADVAATAYDLQGRIRASMQVEN